MATTKGQKMIDYMFCRVEKEERLLASIRRLSPFKRDIIVDSRKGNNTPTFQETCWKATKTNANNIDFKIRNQERDH
jgi:hypothetical protein